MTLTQVRCDRKCLKFANYGIVFVCVLVLSGHSSSINDNTLPKFKSTNVTSISDHNVIRRNMDQVLRRARVRRDLFDFGQQRAIVAKHNELRRLEGSSDMEFMVWNDVLASMAEDWAHRCVWEHGQPSRDPSTVPYDSLGQNLYATAGSMDEIEGIQLWYDEKEFYDYDTGNCRQDPCGHYTQVVWSTSKEVGCAFATCENLVNIGGRFDYLVCNYGPAGNIVNTKPYKIGVACSQCVSGQGWCRDGLCSDGSNCESPQCDCRARCLNGASVRSSDCSCQCTPGWTGTDCSEICANNHPYCGANPGWPAAWCNRDFVYNNCPLLCGLCQASSGTPTTVTTRATPSTVRTTPSTTTSSPPTTTRTTPTTRPTTTTVWTRPPVSNEIKTDVIFVVDSSNTLGLTNWNKLLDFVSKIISQFQTGYWDIQFAFVSYGSTAEVNLYLNDLQNRDAIIRRIASSPWLNEAGNIGAGLSTALNMVLLHSMGGSRQDVPNLVVLLTSGQATDSNSQAAIASMEIKSLPNTILMVFGITSAAQSMQIRNYASGPNFVSFVNSFDELSFTDYIVGNAIREVGGGGPQTTPTPMNTPSSTGGRIKADVVFLVDSSASVGQTNWESSKEFVKSVIAQFHLDDVRIACVTFSSSAVVDIYLDDSVNHAEIFKKIDKLQWKGGSSNFAHSLRTVRTLVFQPSRGDRLDADNLLIMITDGPASAEEERTEQEATLLKAIPYTCFVIIGVTNRVDRNEILQMVSSPASENVRFLDSFSMLDSIENSVVRVITQIGEGSRIGPARTTAFPTVSTEPPRFQPAARGRVDVVFIMDSSGSVGYFNWEKIKDWVIRIVLSFVGGVDDVQFAFVTIGSSGYPDIYFNADVESMYYTIKSLPWRDESSNLAHSMRLTRTDVLHTTNGKRNGVPNVVVLLTDGPATAEEQNTLDEGRALRQQPNTRLMIVGVTSKVDSALIDDINQMATSPASTYVKLIPTFDDLESIRTDVVNVIASVAVGGNIPGPTPASVAKADVVLVMDSSGSVGANDWDRAKDFCKDLLSRYPLGPNNFQFAFISYSNEATVDINLDDFSTTGGFNQKIDSLPWRGGTSNLADSLRKARTDVLVGSAGDRASARNVVIFMTDGPSSQEEENTETEARRLKNVPDTTVFVIGITSRVSDSEINQIASVPISQYVLKLDDFFALSDMSTTDTVTDIVNDVANS